ncbi:hypothetical protein Peternella1_26 [Winogradskyella phage Peternella_1]|uniref:Uncharacterized protein n=1 Tax=Winogradskyella phage Peternella_1 TaxID=2745699 RepID=A0A8E4ZMZ0_9CAUD|nr:hypothetical protein M1M32_gp26 [Winogradskyella phage Peternella_1]QQV91562.1 hypothetical protein Peternella1_26 [Winogradskyella phage Peternella_1]
MDNYRNPIGFKVTDNKLNPESTTQKANKELHNDAKTMALLKIAGLIDQQMHEMATGGLKHQEFSKYYSTDILQQLNKVYIKHYEPI